MDFHWRLFVVNVKEIILTLIDPFFEASDCERVFDEFKSFLALYKEGSSFGALKKIKWSTRIFEGSKPHQDVNDCWNCGAYVLYYIECLANKISMDLQLDLEKYRLKVAKCLIRKAEDISCHCMYCSRTFNVEDDILSTSCAICFNDIHNTCLQAGYV